MGVKNEKSRRLHLIVQQTPVVRRSMNLMDEEWLQVGKLTASIAESIAQAIEQLPYVTQNVLEYTMAEVVSMVLKLNCDHFGFVGGEAEHMAILIKKAWDGRKNMKVYYDTKVQTTLWHPHSEPPEYVPDGDNRIITCMNLLKMPIGALDAMSVCYSVLHSDGSITNCSDDWHSKSWLKEHALPWDSMYPDVWWAYVRDIIPSNI